MEFSWFGCLLFKARAVFRYTAVLLAGNSQGTPLW